MIVLPVKPLVFACAMFVLVPMAAAKAPDAARVDQVATWVAKRPYSPTPEIKDRAFWQKVGRSKDYRDIVKKAESAAKRSFKPLPDELYLDYSRTGNRSRYQTVYFNKLKAFRILVIAECVENKGRFIKPIQQAVASYATDKSWVLPAHDRGLANFKGQQITIDLFASEVACELANADYILGDRLDEPTRALIRQEAKRRIFDPYTTMVTEGKPRMWWLTTTNNWNAVCLANVTSTALALLDGRKEKAFHVAAAEKYITSFLKGFTDDGYCSEGIGYWNYGFGCFVRLGHMLDEVTGGKVDLFDLPKVRNAGLFARRMEVTPGRYPAFADCSVGAKPGPMIMRYVTRRFDLKPTAWELRGPWSLRWLDQFGVYRFMFEPARRGGPTATPAIRDWFPDAGILICRGATTTGGLPLAVALKGGHNAEHHNHNDVGSYIVCIGDAMPLVDPGSEVYTRRTFSSKRYVSGVLNSWGHPVPRVADQLQRTGRSAAAKVVSNKFTDQADTLELDLTSAYSVKSLKQLKRTFVFQRKSAVLTVTDEVEFDTPQSFGTAIITFGAWQKIADNRLRVGQGNQSVIVEINAGELPLTIEATEIDEDVRGGHKPIRIGIDLVKPVRAATIRLTVQAASDAG